MMSFKLITLLILAHNCIAWDSDDFEIFDAIEEINKNFYELMGISQSASVAEIKKAYRNLSKQIHPDKSDAPDADVQFRQLVSAYEILRDDNKRERYNRILVEGIPDWRSAIYYYRKARKMSLLELSIFLTLVISVAQYLMAWGTYLDRRHTLEEYLERKYKVQSRKRRKPEDLDILEQIDEQLNSLERPKCWKILPIQLVQFIIFLCLNGPQMVKASIEDAKMKRRLQEEKIKMENEEEQRIMEEEEKRKEKREMQKQKKKTQKEKKVEVKLTYTRNRKQREETTEQIPVITGGMWTDDDFSDLSRLMAKYPGGTSERWEKIASQMNRTIYEVTKMSGKVKEMLQNRSNVDEIPQPKVKVKTKEKAQSEETNELNAGCDEMWETIEQRALEKALKKYPKGTDQRWDRIASSVPDKSKEDCMLRFKYLADKIKKKKGLDAVEKDVSETTHEDTKSKELDIALQHETNSDNQFGNNLT